VREFDRQVGAGDEREAGKRPVVPGNSRIVLVEAKPEKREGESDAVRGGGELLGEKDQPDRPEEIQRPADRACDEESRESALR
jgi:hypothetical protein